MKSVALNVYKTVNTNPVNSPPRIINQRKNSINHYS